MASDFVYDGTDLVICNGIAGTLKDFADLYDYDVGNALTVLDAKTIATDPEAFSLDIALQPADSLAVKLTISASADRTGARVNITGTDLDGNAISETEIDISGANSTPVVTELNFATVDAAGIVVSGMTADDTITITQPRKGICWEIEEDKQYYIENVADFAVGNDSTETHFGGAENVLFAGGVMPRVRTNAFLTIEGKWIIAPDATLNMIATGETGTITIKKGGGIKITTNYAVNFYSGTVDFSNCSLVHNDKTNSSCRLYFRDNLISQKYNNVLFENFYQTFFYKTPNEMSDVRVNNITWAVYGVENITLRNVVVTNHSNADFGASAGKTVTLINCSPVKAPVCANATATIIEQHTCDIKVNDPDGAGLEGVTVTCDDQADSEVFSVDTTDGLKVTGALDPNIVGDMWNIGAQAAAGDYDPTSPDPIVYQITLKNGAIYYLWHDDTGTEYWIISTVIGTPGTYYWRLAYAAGDPTGSYTAQGSATGTATVAAISGLIPQQLIEKTRFTGTDETETPKNPHVFTFTRTNYVDETLNNVTVDAPIDWLHEVVSDVEIALEDPEITLEDS